MKNTFPQLSPKKLVYRDNKNFDIENFRNEFEKKKHSEKDITDSENLYVKTLDKHAPKKTNVVRAIQRPHISKELRKD